MSFDSFGDYATIVVFGASGDLAKKKTFPALFGLFRENNYHQRFKSLVMLDHI